jgi:MFS family permease
MDDVRPDALQPLAERERWVGAEVLTIIAAQIVFGLGWSLYLLVPKFLATALGAGPELIGRTNAAGGLAGILLVPIAAVGIDRFGRKLFFRAGAVLIVIVSLGYMHVDAVGWPVFVLQGCIAAAFGLAFNANAALLADWAPPSRLGQAIGWLGAANVLTNAVSTAIAEPIAMRYGWNPVFGLGVALASTALLLSVFLRPAPVRASTAGVLETERNAFDVRALVEILFATTLIGCVFSALFVFVQPYALQLGAHEVHGFFVGFTVAAVLCRLLLGGLGDRFGRRRVAVWMCVAYALSALLTRHLDPTRLWLDGLAFGAAHGLLYPTLNAVVLETVPSSRRGFGMAFYNGAFNAGTALSSVGWGWLAQKHGYPIVYACACALALAAAFVLAAGQRSSRSWS